MPRTVLLAFVVVLTAALAACSSNAPNGPATITHLSGDVPAASEKQSDAPLPVFPMFNSLIGF